MKTEKLNLGAIKNVLSRREMKKIMAGSGPCGTLGASCGGHTGVVCCPSLKCNPSTPIPDQSFVCQA